MKTRFLPLLGTAPEVTVTPGYKDPTPAGVPSQSHLRVFKVVIYHRASFMQIHPTAIISPQAALGIDVRVGPYVVIEDEVQIGDGCEIGAHAVVKRFTKLGSRNRVFELAVLGGEPQDVKFRGEKSFLQIGDDNLIREFCTLHRASEEGKSTRIGSRNFFCHRSFGQSSRF